MKHNTETICDDNGIEILVDYEYEKSESFEAEPGNPGTHVDELVYTELNSVEVLIAGQGINILSRLNEKQKEIIISKLTY